MFGAKRKMRFRPSYFPFTEPSAEVDIWDEERHEWLEILGCGMVDPNVLDNVGYDSNIWHGYAFGMGVERIAMLKYNINDMVKDDVIFCATGVTDGNFLKGIKNFPNSFESETLVLQIAAIPIKLLRIVLKNDFIISILS